MNYFKNTNNEIFAYDNSQVKQGYGKDLTPITLEEVEAINKAKEEAYIASLDYKQLRVREYPQLGEQLDALYHYFEANGIVNDFTTMIKEVKDKYPKGGN